MLKAFQTAAASASLGSGFLVQNQKNSKTGKTTRGVVAARLQDGCVRKPTDSSHRGPANANPSSSLF
jgi:hypothetical protein